MTASPPEPFFSGPGLDRADALRGDPDALKGLAADPLSRQLKWDGGLPALSDEGRLQWDGMDAPVLFLGFDGKSPCFSAIEDVTADARAAFPLMALLDGDDAPLFAAALSLARWHSHHRFCANCGQLSEIIRGVTVLHATRRQPGRQDHDVWVRGMGRLVGAG